MTENCDDRIRLTLARSTGFALDVDLKIPSGGVTVLFGVSGCGKTTILRSAAGLERAQGYVRVAGQVWQDDEKKIFVPTYQRRIGYVFQEASLFDHLNVRENLRYGLKRISDKDGEKDLTMRSSFSASGIFCNAVHRNFPVANASVAPLRGHWRSSPLRCSWMSRWRRWIMRVVWKSCLGSIVSRPNSICRYCT